MPNTNRRTLIAGLVTAAIPLNGQQPESNPPKPVRPEPNRGPRQDLDLIKAFVVAGHANKNIDLVKEMLAKDPKLVLAAWDWGAGDWETALGGASHTGSRDMARFL